jgi:hypothetical protein
MTTIFPLEKTTDGDLRQLSETLWRWGKCLSCEKNHVCEAKDCPMGRKKSLQRFFDYYKYITRSYAPDVEYGETPAFATHQDLFNLIGILKSEPEATRAQVGATFFQGRYNVPDRERDKAINLAVRVLVMISSVADTEIAMLLESGPYPASWRQDTPFSQFISETLPTSDHPSLNDVDSSSFSTRRSLTAIKLQKRARLSFEPTDDIHNHLKLEDKTGIVYIFHHTAVLKEHLLLTKDLPAKLSISESLQRGALPRQLALEVLDSIQKLLFPLNDSKSRALLMSLTSKAKGAFDPDCLRFESSSIRRPEEHKISYYYLGERLMDLYSELDDPRPRGGLARWLERRSRPRYVMLTTLAGVMIAVLLGLAGLIVSIFQTWVTYQSWKHPVQK